MKKRAYYNKMFKFVKQIFISAMMFFGCNLSNVNSLKCVPVNNQECKIRPEIVNVNSDMNLYFLLLVLKQVNAAVVVIISMIYLQNCVFLRLLKTLI